MIIVIDLICKIQLSQQTLHPVQENGGSSESGETRRNISEVKAEVKDLVGSFKDFSHSIKGDFDSLKSVVDKTYDLVVDARFRVSWVSFFLNLTTKI